VRIFGRNGQEILSVDDWFAKAPPKQGARHWKDYRSAKELAKSWFATPSAGPPEDLPSFLRRSFPPGDVVLTDGYPECVIPLDRFRGEKRNADLVVLGTAGSQKLLVSIEAKADEPFGDQLVGEYYYHGRASPCSNVPTRIAALTRAFFNGDPDLRTRSLRYQLLHATAGTLIEAKRRHAQIAVFLVHEFISHHVNAAKLAANQNDWQAFVAALVADRGTELATDRAIGPINVRGGEHVPSAIPLYLGKLQTFPP
jgi:hypothetical protein